MEDVLTAGLATTYSKETARLMLLPLPLLMLLKIFTVLPLKMVNVLNVRVGTSYTNRKENASRWIPYVKVTTLILEPVQIAILVMWYQTPNAPLGLSSRSPTA